jgi:hypothetical protein
MNIFEILGWIIVITMLFPFLFVFFYGFILWAGIFLTALVGFWLMKKD